MSLFNMIMGRNPLAPQLLAVIGITLETKDKYPIGRIRDVYTNDAADRVFILHRNYGEAGIPYDEAMSKHPLFVRKFQADEGMDGSCSDETYQVYEFRVPDDEFLKSVVRHVADTTETVPPMRRWLDVLKAMKDNPSGPEMTEVVNSELGQRLKDALAESDGTVIIDAIDPDHPMKGGGHGIS